MMLQTKDAVQFAMKLNESELQGRQIRVIRSQENPSTGNREHVSLVKFHPDMLVFSPVQTHLKFTKNLPSKWHQTLIYNTHTTVISNEQ